MNGKRAGIFSQLTGRIYFEPEVIVGRHFKMVWLVLILKWKKKEKNQFDNSITFVLVQQRDILDFKNVVLHFLVIKEKIS